MTVTDCLCIWFAVRYKNGETKLEFLIDTGVAKTIFLEKYNSLINLKEILPIELLLKEDKEFLVKECRATGLKFTNQTLTDAARILYTLKQIGV